MLQILYYSVFKRNKLEQESQMTAHRPNPAHSQFFLNKVLLEHSHIPCLHTIYGCISYKIGELSSCSERQCGPQNLKILIC